MSLINQVLKDLERRHAGEDRGAARAVQPLPDDGPRRGLWIALSVLSACVLSGGGAWWYLSRPESPPAALLPLAEKPALPAASASTAAPDSSPSPQSRSTATAQTPAAGSTSPATAPPSATLPPQSVAAPTGPPPNVNPQIAGMPGAPAAPASVSGPVSPPSPKALATEEASAATSTADSAVKPVRKARPKSAEADAAKRGLPAIQSAEYPEPDGPVPAPSIDKQVRPPSDRERAEAEFRRGMLALQGGNDTEGEDRLRAALAIDPLADKARQALLGLYVQRGRREDAERLLEDRLRLDRRHAGFAMALARLQLERGANGEALVSLQRTLPNGESNADYQAMLATTLARVGRHKEAAERYEVATRLAPRNPVWLMGMGVELRADNRAEEARAAFQRAKDLGGLDAQLASFVDQQIKDLKLK